MIRTLSFHNFKGLENYRISLKDFNVLVGPNNAGKSTVLDALRILSGVVKVAQRRVPVPLRSEAKLLVRGYKVPDSSIPVPLTNIHTNYADIDTVVKLTLANGNAATLLFRPQRECIFYLQEHSSVTRDTKDFRGNYPVDIAIVPTLGPFEEEENVLEEEYFKRWAFSRRSHRMFRNIWYRKPDAEFVRFKEYVEETWPGMSIMKPELLDRRSRQLAMFCKEGRYDREIYWAGFGFQVWLQLLTHILEAGNATTLVIDEPDIYLHPDLQRRALQILRGLGRQVVLATHAVEIINDVEHDEIVLVDKSHSQARRINDKKGLQDVLSHIGSTQNITLSRLARARKALFFEGEDFKIWRRFARKLGFQSLASAIELTVLQTEGISQWRKVEDAAWTFEKLLETKVRICAVFDSDFNCRESIEEFIEKLSKTIEQCFVLDRKEIENYCLDSSAIASVVAVALSKKQGSAGRDHGKKVGENVTAMLNRLVEDSKPYVLGQLVASRAQFFRRNRRDDSTIVSETVEAFEQNWRAEDFRIARCPGKKVLRELAATIQDEFGVSVTQAAIIDQMSVATIPERFVSILRYLDEFAKP